MMSKEEFIEYIIVEAFREKISEAIELKKEEVSFKAKISYMLDGQSDIYKAYQKGLDDGRKEAEEHLSSRPKTFDPLITGNNSKPSKISDTQAKAAVPVYLHELDDILKKHTGLYQPYKKEIPE